MAKTDLALVAKKILSKKCRYGNSRHKAKIEETDQSFIYSLNTYKTYVKQSTAYFNWLKETHPKANTLNKAKGYIQEYIDRYDSAFSQATISSSLCKLYSCPKSELGIQTKERHRSDIKRSRHDAIRDKHFSEENNKGLISFCKNTGLRRFELERLKPENLQTHNGDFYLKIKGKGGKERLAKILNNNKDVVEKIRNTPSGQLVWGKVSQNADIHHFRALYAQEYYKSIERDLSNISHDEKYYCRKDKSGTVYDRKAMLEVSRSLGHNRIDVIARNYLY